MDLKRSSFSPPLAKEILLLAWPTLLQIMMNTAVQYVDTAMVGRLGTNAMAAIGSTAAVGGLINCPLFSLAISFLIHVSKAYGSGDLQKARAITDQAMLTVLVYGSILTAVNLTLSPFLPGWVQAAPEIRQMASQYFFLCSLPMVLRSATVICGNILWAVGDTKTPMLTAILVNAVNLTCDFFLIFPTRYFRGIRIPGAGLGVMGAGIGSLISYCAEGLCLITVLWRNPEISPRGRRLRPDKTLLLSCVRTALPNMLQSIGTSLAGSVFSTLVNGLGAVATATHSITGTVQSACACDFRNVVTPITSRINGSGNQKKQRQLLPTLLSMELILVLPICLVVFLFAPQLMRLFSSDPEVLTLGTTILRIMAGSEPIYRVVCILEKTIHGKGDTATPFLYNILTVWIIRIGGTFLCVKHFSFGLPAVWICVSIQYAALFLLFFRHIRRTK